MLIKRKKIVAGLSILLIVLCCLGSCACISIFMINNYMHSSNSPRKNIAITLAVTQQQNFFDQLQKFADKHAFTFRKDAGPRQNTDFLLEMARPDIKLTGTNGFAAGEYKIFFYDVDPFRPAPEAVFDDLVNDLKSFISVIPGATFSIKK